jgi:4-aminobutyrate aminotransferase
MQRGMMILPTSMFDVLRLIPPLTVTETEMDAGLDILCESVRAVVK